MKYVAQGEDVGICVIAVKPGGRQAFGHSGEPYDYPLALHNAVDVLTVRTVAEDGPTRSEVARQVGPIPDGDVTGPAELAVEVGQDLRLVVRSADPLTP